MTSLVRFAGKLRRRVRSARWPPHTRLFLQGDEAGWVLDREIQALAGTCGRLGIKTEVETLIDGYRKQVVFYPSIYHLLRSLNRLSDWRVTGAWFHGTPKYGSNPTPEQMAFNDRFECFKRCHERVDRIQVSNSSFREVVLESGVAPEKIHVIPIGIDIAAFPFRLDGDIKIARTSLGIPESAIVVGSFQKDGKGWGDGLDPKLCKGPDVFIECMRILAERISNLYVLLSGPARGYVKKGLTSLGIPYKHILCQDYSAIPELYRCLDVYLVASRDEGGPKAILESMASGVPIVTTRVGQARDLVVNGKNGWIADTDDVGALAHYVEEAVSGSVDDIVAEARVTAEKCDYPMLDPLWKDFFHGLVK